MCEGDIVMSKFAFDGWALKREIADANLGDQEAAKLSFEDNQGNRDTFYLPVSFDRRFLMSHKPPGLEIDTLNYAYNHMENPPVSHDEIQKMVDMTPVRVVEVMDRANSQFDELENSVKQRMWRENAVLAENKLKMDFHMEDTHDYNVYNRREKLPDRVGYIMLAGVGSSIGGGMKVYTSDVKEENRQEIPIKNSYGKTFVVGYVSDVDLKTDNPDLVTKKIKENLVKMANDIVKEYSDRGYDLANRPENDRNKRFVKAVEKAYGLDLGVTKNEKLPSFLEDKKMQMKNQPWKQSSLTRQFEELDKEQERGNTGR